MPLDRRDPVVNQERVDIVRECFGVTASGKEGYYALKALDADTLVAGWTRLQAWQKDEPPAGDAPGQAPPQEAQASPSPADAEATASLLAQLRAVAPVVGVTRELEDLIASCEQEHDGLAWEEATRVLFFQEVCDQFPAVVEAINTAPDPQAREPGEDDA
jgi:hypothetical protein